MDNLIEQFENKLTSVGGSCQRVKNKKELTSAIQKILQEKNTTDISIYESKGIRQLNLKKGLEKLGITIYNDDFKKKISAVGLTEMQWGIAELGTLVQVAPEVDNRICSTFIDTHIALLKTSAILPDLDAMLGKISEFGEGIPNFIGFVTGPSRSSDIERVLTIGVHGPKELIAILIEE